MRIRVDFGRIFPGLVLLLAGLVLLVILVLVAALAFLFSFIGGAGTILGAALELTLIPAFLIVAGIVTILTGVSWWGKGGEGWFSRVARARASDDMLRVSQRAGEIIGVVVTLIVFVFLYENQLRGVAFFTQSFGAEEQFFFYAPLFAGVLLSLARATYGHRNGVRPFDSLNALFLAVAAFWLLSVFPFDFTHLGDMFPTSIQFLFGWLNNDIGRVLFAFAGVVSLVNCAYTSILFAYVRNQLYSVRARPLGM